MSAAAYGSGRGEGSNKKGQRIEGEGKCHIDIDI